MVGNVGRFGDLLAQFYYIYLLCTPYGAS